MQTFSPLEKEYPDVKLVHRFIRQEHSQDYQIFKVNGGDLYIKSSQEGSFIGVNPFFDDHPNSHITLVNPENSALTWKVNVD